MDPILDLSNRSLIFAVSTASFPEHAADMAAGVGIIADKTHAFRSQTVAIDLEDLSPYEIRHPGK